jgi:hypothetical protein
LTYRQHRLVESGQPRVVIPWQSLAHQLGADYGRLRAFRSAFVEALRVVLVVYPEGNAAPSEAGLVLTPGRPHVRHVPARRRPTLHGPGQTELLAPAGDAPAAATNAP